MNNVIHCDFNGKSISFTGNGWFNATAAAKRFGKSPYEWLRLPETSRYLKAMKSKYGKIPYLKTTRGNGGGTWLHPKLAVAFARWLDADFALWCDEQIDELLRTGQQQAMTVWQELMAVQREDATSLARASFGSHLMLGRKQALPGIRSRQRQLEAEVMPQLRLIA